MTGMSASHSDVLSVLSSVYFVSKMLKPFLRIVHSGMETVADFTDEGIPYMIVNMYICIRSLCLYSSMHCDTGFHDIGVLNLQFLLGFFAMVSCFHMCICICSHLLL